ncbi:MAG TPA: nitronate monooxygenase [Acidimicrobiales bacterium]|jgi:enoyl-[acyl-carrier protein] reductase II|nr:nitronate monooxygenase [Acidimicrobiales bacterium]
MTDGRPAALRNRLTELLGVDYPIVQAPMGYIARAALASAVSNAGGLGIVETSSGRLDQVRDEMLGMRELTDRPWGVNIAQLFVTNEDIVAFVAGLGVSFVTTSAGDPSRFTAALHDAGITVFHVVPSLRAAAKAMAAGVDGLVVEGGEGGGFKNTKPVATIVLVPQIRRECDLPIIAAGGISDGPAMAAAFALGADGVQMGTRMVSAAESPVHTNYKQLVVDADATDTVVLSAHSSPAYRVMRTPLTESLQQEPAVRMHERVGMDGVLELYFEGNLSAGFAFGGQVAGLVDSVVPVREIIEGTMAGFYATVDRLGALTGGWRSTSGMRVDEGAG